MGVAGEIGEDGLRSGERPLGVDNPCDRESSGEENEHEVLKPFIAIQRVRLLPAKGSQPSGSEPCMACGDARREG